MILFDNSKKPDPEGDELFEIANPFQGIAASSIPLQEQEDMLEEVVLSIVDQEGVSLSTVLKGLGAYYIDDQLTLNGLIVPLSSTLTNILKSEAEANGLTVKELFD